MGAKNNNSHSEVPPGPSGLPVIGVLPRIFRGSLAFVDDLTEHGDAVRRTVSRLKMYALFHPDDIQQVLLDDFDTSRRWEVDELREFLGLEFWAPDGLIGTQGERWRR